MASVQVVIVPDSVEWTKNASLYITGGDCGSGFPQATDKDMVIAASIAMMSKIITGVLFQIPNEHVTFTSDPEQLSRTEGAIDAFTWVTEPDQLFVPLLELQCYI